MIKSEKEIQVLYDCKDRLLDQIREEYGPIKKAKRQDVYDDYVAVNRAIYSKIRAREQAVLKQAQADYDANAAVKDIQEQLSGSVEFAKPISPILSTIEHASTERSRIAKAFFYDKLVFAAKDWFTERLEIVNSLISLCAPRITAKRKLSLESLHDQDHIPLTSTSHTRKLALKDQDNTAPDFKSRKLGPAICKPEPAEVELFPVQCTPHQCLFCIGNPGLPLTERLREYKCKFSLQRHAQRCRLKSLEPDEVIACPHHILRVLG